MLHPREPASCEGLASNSENLWAFAVVFMDRAACLALPISLRPREENHAEDIDGGAIVAVLGYGAAPSAAETWTGKISDSSCGASHDTMTEHGKKGTDKDCTLMCVKKGSQYVFVNEGKVLKITNQDFKSLQRFAGETIKVTGDLDGDAITATKIEKPM